MTDRDGGLIDLGIPNPNSEESRFYRENMARKLTADGMTGESVPPPHSGERLGLPSLWEGDTPTPEEEDGSGSDGGSSLVPVEGGADLPRHWLISARFGVESRDLDELADIGLAAMNSAMREITRAGFAFLRARDLLSLGWGGDRRSKCKRSHFEKTEDTDDGFLAWIEERGLAKERVYEAMRIAQFVARLPEKDLDRISSLPKTKVMLLAALPQETIESAEGAGLLEEAQYRSVAELKEDVRTLRARNANLSAEAETSRLRLKEVEKGRGQVSPFLPNTEMVREESVAHRYGIELHLKELETLFDQVNGEGADSPEWRLRMDSVASAIQLSASRAFLLVEGMRERAVEDLPRRVVGEACLTVEEAERWIIDAPLIENRKKGEAAWREGQRAKRRPRGPGRPRKVAE
uniref:Uncharacterized protein n=1 Tax=Candidatus Kentrum sp. LFY TaxID=2126342 RepID=A0A450UEA9_9GAMM|nr:MAG: hypothetical protein BECKLFY1418A_GA0070994_101350 [Candidatus Kentron sp. LFY]